MRTCGLSRQKLSYIRDLAEKTLHGEIVFERLSQLTDAEVIQELTRVKGIGVWSAQMFLMFALRRQNVMPTGDYGIRAAIKKAYRKRNLPKPEEMLKLSRKWHPYCTLACYYLWRSLDIETPSTK
jgi:DNA-3-methyladenine glycosylase II